MMSYQVSIKREFLDSLLDKASTVSRGELSPLLKSYLVEVDKQFFRVVRTDNILSAVAVTSVFESSGESFRFLVNAEKFSELIKSLSGDMVTLSFNPPVELGITCENYSAIWRLFAVEDFPVLPSFGERPVFAEFDAKLFAQAIDRVKYSASTSSFRPDWRQIYFDKGLCYAMDGLKYQEVLLDAGTQDVFSIPLIATEIVRFVRLTAAEKITVSKDEKYFYFRAGAGNFFICLDPKVGELSYNPKNDLFGPESRKATGWFTCEVNVLKEILRRVGITSRRGDHRVKFTVKASSVVVGGKDDDGNISSDSMIITLQGSSSAIKSFDIQWDLFFDGLSMVKSATADCLIGETHVGIRSDDSFGIIPILKELK